MKRTSRPNYCKQRLLTTEKDRVASEIYVSNVTTPVDKLIYHNKLSRGGTYDRSTTSDEMESVGGRGSTVMNNDKI